MVVATLRPSAWERYAWAAGVVFVLALVAEVAISVGIPVNQDSSAAKIASELDEHRKRLLAVAFLSIVYATAFVIYLWRLYDLLRGSPDRRQALSSLVLVGGILFVTLHAVSDVGIIGMLGAKLIGFVLFLIFVLVSSVIVLRREAAVPATPVESTSASA